MMGNKKAAFGARNTKNGKDNSSIVSIAIWHSNVKRGGDTK